MKGMDLLNALGRVQDTYVISAGDFRENQGQPRRLSLRRTWLIAAVIALALLLVGCAAVFFLASGSLHTEGSVYSDIGFGGALYYPHGKGYGYRDHVWFRREQFAEGNGRMVEFPIRISSCL